MALIQWHGDGGVAFRDLAEIQDRFNRILEGSFGRSGVEHGTSTFPPVDIRVDDDSVYLVAELPGVAAESLDLSITGDTLTIKGERKAAQVAEQKYHRRERPMGHFTRLVSLPERVDADKIQAALKDGILRVTLPKSESARPRTIKIAQQ
jgi:HSP20 family protein